MSALPKASMNGVELSEDDRIQLCVDNLGWTAEQARRVLYNTAIVAAAQSGDRIALEFAKLHARIAELEHECATLRRAAETIPAPADEHAPTLPSTPAAMEESGIWTK